MLGKWLSEQRQILLGKRKGKTLTTEQIKTLRSIGFTLESTFDQRWDKCYAVIKDYYDQHGNARIPVAYGEGLDFTPYHWINNQKAAYKAGKMDGRRVELLKAVGAF